MPRPQPVTRESEPPENININSWSQGVQLTTNKYRVPEGGIASVQNMMLAQDGVVKPRFSVIPYIGNQSYIVRFSGRNTTRLTDAAGIAGTPVGFQKRDTDGSIGNYVIAPFRYGNEIILAYHRIDTADENPNWTQVARYSMSADLERDLDLPIEIKKNGRYLTVTNGQTVREGNSIGFIDVTKPTLEEIIPHLIDQPEGFTSINRTTVSQAELDNAQYVYRYCYTIQTPTGETEASPLSQIETPFFRGRWQEKNFKITLEIPRPSVPDTPATFNIYIGLQLEDRTEPLYLMDSEIPITTTTYEDTGKPITEFDRQAPIGSNSTDYPAVRHSGYINGRIVLYGDVENPDRLWYSGKTGLDKLNFAPTATSGFLDITASDDEDIIAVVPFKDSTKAQGFLVYTSQGDAGEGAEYFVSEVFDRLPNGLQASYLRSLPTGESGSVAPYGVVRQNDIVIRPTLNGFKYNGQIPTLPDTISTDYLDQSIRVRSLDLDYTQMMKCNGVKYKQKVLFSLPDPNSVTTRLAGRPNSIWSLDLDQSTHTWMTDIGIEADWIINVPDQFGRESLLIFREENNKVNMFKVQDQRSDLDPFEWSFESGALFSPTGRSDLYTMIEVAVELHSLEGVVKIDILGRTQENRDEGILGTRIVGSPGVSSNKPKVVGNKLGDAPYKPEKFTIGSYRITVDDGDIHYARLRITSQSPDAYCEVSNFSFSYVYAGLNQIEDE